MRQMLRTLSVGALSLAVSCVFVQSALAELPVSFTHKTRYIQSNGSYSYWSSGTEAYTKSTLPNEWYASWSNNTLDAGAVIIRSGVYWRINRSVMGSGWPFNNCYRVWVGSNVYYHTAPTSRGGREEWHPNSGVTSTNNAVNRTYRYHAEKINRLPGAPDPYVGLRYNSNIQNRTANGSGGWLSKIRYAYTGPGSPYEPFDPNQECSQEDDLTNSDPQYVNY